MTIATFDLPDNLTVLSVEASDELRVMVLAWLDNYAAIQAEGREVYPLTEAQHEVFKALGIEVEGGQR